MATRLLLEAALEATGKSPGEAEALIVDTQAPFWSGPGCAGAQPPGSNAPVLGIRT